MELENRKVVVPLADHHVGVVPQDPVHTGCDVGRTDLQVDVDELDLSRVTNEGPP